YISFSVATIWIYDYACSLHEEWTFLLRSHWSKVKCLYIVTRYLPSILLAANLYCAFRSSTHHPDNELILGYYFPLTGLSIVAVMCSECIFCSSVRYVCF
ncbi:hypothetical protein DFJ58DRAFT_805649, partial [Suillus subalutaceus]|uniref:uncharacterized protein n=1 Tax=Suillus subalutaceus TaxID=48586 RepID=UPI001B861A91